jgi:hypothetical protein
MTAPQPSVGRVVHYVSHGTPVRPDGSQAFTSQCRTAFVTEVTEHPEADGTAGLMVANPTGLFFHSLADGGVPHAEDKAAGADEHPGGTWHWPERVPEGTR